MEISYSVTGPKKDYTSTATYFRWTSKISTACTLQRSHAWNVWKEVHALSDKEGPKYLLQDLRDFDHPKQGGM
jgi:hypothetical protein